MFTFLDFFAGIGGFRTGLERVGGECKGFAEIDKYARQSYKAMHDTEGELEWHDITAVTDEHFRDLRGQIDLIAGGFPCQNFSVAGKRMGFNESRGTLFFHIARAAKEIQPRYLLLENVKGLVSHDQGRTLTIILNTLQELGYGHIEWGIFNSKFWGVPQNRERIFIVAERVSEPQRPYLLDLLKQQEENGVQTRLRDILETNVDEKYYLSEEKTKALVENIESNNKKDIENIDIMCFNPKDKKGVQTVQTDRVYDPKGLMTSILSGNNGRFHIAEQENFIEMHEDHVRVREATKKGYAEAYPGDAVNLAQPNSKTRRGRVGRELANTLLTGLEQAVIVPHTHVVADLNHYGNEQMNRVYGVDGQAPTIIAVSGGGREPKISIPPDYRIRKLTVLECWRLQGFSDAQHAASVDSSVSDSQRYKQAGNSVTVNVIEVIGRQIAERINGTTNII